MRQSKAAAPGREERAASPGDVSAQHRQAVAQLKLGLVGVQHGQWWLPPAPIPAAPRSKPCPSLETTLPPPPLQAPPRWPGHRGCVRLCAGLCATMGSLLDLHVPAAAGQQQGSSRASERASESRRAAQAASGAGGQALLLLHCSGGRPAWLGAALPSIHALQLADRAGSGRLGSPQRGACPRPIEQQSTRGPCWIPSTTRTDGGQRGPRRDEKTGAWATGQWRPAR